MYEDNCADSRLYHSPCTGSEVRINNNYQAGFLAWKGTDNSAVLNWQYARNYTPQAITLDQVIIA